MAIQLPVGLIGAYERDNFGDLLFLERTRRYLASAGIDETTLAPFGSSREQLTGSRVDAVSTMARRGSCGALWTVGGEVGGVAAHSAYLMLDGDARPPDFHDLPRRARRRIIRREFDGPLLDLAYVPRPSAFPASWPVPSILNSVGVSGIAGLTAGVAANARYALRDADYISVREKTSSGFLESLRIPHVLAPDLVHTMRRDHADLASRDAREVARASRKVLVQMSAATLSQQGVAALADALCSSRHLEGADVRLFVAGLAPHHDSLELYREVVARIEARKPSFRVSLSPAHGALDKVVEIATSELVIATSLHATILSMSFDVPHVGLLIDKLSRYAATWGDPMPTAVSLRDLPVAIESALGLEGEVVESGLADRLASSADDSIRSAIEVVQSRDTDLAAARTRRRARHSEAARREGRRPRNLAAAVTRSVVRPLS